MPPIPKADRGYFLVDAKRVRDLSVLDHCVAAETRVCDLTSAHSSRAGGKLCVSFVTAFADAVCVAGTGFSAVREGLDTVLPLQFAARGYVPAGCFAGSPLFGSRVG